LKIPSNDIQGFSKPVVAENLYKHVEYLSVKIGDRHLWKKDSLNRAADYIESVFHISGYAVERQTYSCYGQSVSNLIAVKEGKENGVVVVDTLNFDDMVEVVKGLYYTLLEI